MPNALASPPVEGGSDIMSRMAMLDTIANESALLTAPGNPFTLAVSMATAISKIRSALTDDVMSDIIMPLMNTKLGFRTDKDPARPVWNKAKGRSETPEPYTIAIVRECVIEAILRGLPIIGNCWNIISAQTYVTKEGFWFLLGNRVPGLTDFKPVSGIPRMVKPPGDARNTQNEEAKGALVACSASWKLNGTADSLEKEIPIRVNAMMGTDAILGKAERKLLAASYAQITGTPLGDADASEVEVELRNVTRSPEPTAGPAPADEGTGNAFADFADDESGAPEDAPADEEFIPAKALEDIQGMLGDAKISMPKFEGMLKRGGFLSPAETLSAKLPIEKLRAIHGNAAAVIAGTYQKEGT